MNTSCDVTRTLLPIGTRIHGIRGHTNAPIVQPDIILHVARSCVISLAAAEMISILLYIDFFKGGFELLLPVSSISRNPLASMSYRVVG